MSSGVKAEVEANEKHSSLSQSALRSLAEQKSGACTFLKLPAEPRGFIYELLLYEKRGVWENLTRARFQASQ